MKATIYISRNAKKEKQPYKINDWNEYSHKIQVKNCYITYNKELAGDYATIWIECEDDNILWVMAHH